MKFTSPTLARRPGFRFSQGQICITTAQEEMRLGTWENKQLLRACNQGASPMTWHAVQTWLARESVSI